MQAVESRARRLLGPALTLAGVGAATCFVAAFNPNEPGPYPPCPSQLLFGVDCPGCGGLRATYALTRGDLGAAADNNLLFVLLLPAVVVGFGLWVLRAWRGRGPSTSPQAARVRSAALGGVVALVVVFTLLRNVVPYLGSGLG